MKTKINRKQICSISSHIDKPCANYKYLEQEKLMGISIQSEGYHYMLDPEPIMVNPEDIERDGTLVCKYDRVVYYKPHVTIGMSNGNNYVKYFESQHELDIFVDEITVDFLNLGD